MRDVGQALRRVKSLKCARQERDCDKVTDNMGVIMRWEAKN